jgi:hypothetical protein
VDAKYNKIKTLCCYWNILLFSLWAVGGD